MLLRLIERLGIAGKIILAGVLTGLLALPGLLAVLAARVELEGLRIGAYPRIVQRAGQIATVAPQHLERGRAFGADMRAQAALVVELDADLDLAELHRIEPNDEVVPPILAVPCDLDADVPAELARPRGNRLRWREGGRGRGCGGL